MCARLCVRMFKHMCERTEWSGMLSRGEPRGQAPKAYIIRHTYVFYICIYAVCTYVYNIRSVSSSIGVTGVRIQREIQKEREREKRKTTNENGVGCYWRKK